MQKIIAIVLLLIVCTFAIVYGMKPVPELKGRLFAISSDGMIMIDLKKSDEWQVVLPKDTSGPPNYKIPYQKDDTRLSYIDLFEKNNLIYLLAEQNKEYFFLVLDPKSLELVKRISLRDSKKYQPIIMQVGEFKLSLDNSNHYVTSSYDGERKKKTWVVVDMKGEKLIFSEQEPVQKEEIQQGRMIGWLDDSSILVGKVISRPSREYPPMDIYRYHTQSKEILRIGDYDRSIYSNSKIKNQHYVAVRCGYKISPFDANETYIAIWDMKKNYFKEVKKFKNPVIHSNLLWIE